MPPHQHNEQCREVFALLSQYLDGELPAEVLDEIEAHIAGCEPCVEFTRSLRHTVALCRAYQPRQVPGPIGTEAKAKLTQAWQAMLKARLDSGNRAGN